MSDPRGFLKVARKKEGERAVDDRVRDWNEIAIAHSEDELRAQASRCMDCGIPFCHQGCPLGNLIPEWNDLVHEGRHDEAITRLHEASCVLNLHESPVTIKEIERAIADRLLATPLVPNIARTKREGRVAIIGSGPAGLAAAQEIAKKGYEVTVFERDDRIGGLLRYGIPDFKMEKAIIDRRVLQMTAEGVRFVVSTAPSASFLRSKFDAIVLAIGARTPRDLPIPGRDLDGVHYAMDFLVQQNRVVANLPFDARDGAKPIIATGKNVVVIGGGDTGSDCVGTSIRQGAKSVTQLELMPKPELVRMPQNPWPEWPLILRTSSSHDEGAARDWSVRTRAFAGDGRVMRIETDRVALEGGKFTAIQRSQFSIECDLVLLAMGFTGPEPQGIVSDLGVALDARGNVRSDARGHTSANGVFAAGDASRGQSLVVWAIADGRRVASGVSAYLENKKAETVRAQNP
jgi:glutamate synthase (NADPH/NADH) small chain